MTEAQSYAASMQVSERKELATVTTNADLQVCQCSCVFAADNTAYPAEEKHQGKLACQASRGRRVRPPSTPMPGAATTALALLHPPRLFVELASRQSL